MRRLAQFASLTLIACLGCVSRVAPPPARVAVTTEHFQLFSSGWPELALEMANRLELFHLVGRELLDLDTAEERARTRLFVLDDALWYGDFGAGQVSRGWLFQHPVANYMAVQGLSQQEEALRFAQNMYTRILQQTRQTRALPRWYAVGISELLSTVEVRSEYVLVGKVSRFRKGLLERGFRERNQRGPQRGGPRRGTWVPLRSVMTTANEQPWMRERRSMFYAEAWALTFYLSRKHPRELSEYLHQVGSGTPHERAFEAAFGVSHVVMEQKLERYFRGRDRLWRFPREHFPVASQARTDRLDPATWEMRIGELLLIERNPERAPAAERHFRRAIALEGELASAHAGLGVARAIQGKRAGERSIERALALAPEDPSIRLLAGEYFSIRARQTTPFDSGRLERARAELRNATERAPELAAAHHLLGYTYLFPGEDAEQAVQALELAHALMSWQHDIALALGEAYLRARRIEDARRVLGRVVRGTSNESNRKRANDLLAEIDVAAGGRSR